MTSNKIFCVKETVESIAADASNRPAYETLLGELRAVERIAEDRRLYIESCLEANRIQRQEIERLNDELSDKKVLLCAAIDYIKINKK